MTAPIASGWSDCRVGFSPTGKRRLCTAHAMNRRQPTPSTGQSWTSSRRKTPRLSKNPLRESQTERTPPTLVRHILVRRVRGRYPRQHLTTMEVGDGSRPPFLQCSVCLGDSGTQFALLLVTVSLERMKISECCRYESRSEH